MTDLRDRVWLAINDKIDCEIPAKELDRATEAVLRIVLEEAAKVAEARKFQHETTQQVRKRRGDTVGAETASRQWDTADWIARRIRQLLDK